MIVIGITGSLASGKSTVAKLIAGKKYPLFSADKVVLDLYKNSRFINLIIKKFKLSSKIKIKKQIKSIIIKNNYNLSALESIVHPIVRKKMNNFLKIKTKIKILEIPLLIENKLNKHFDKIIFVDTKEALRLKRYLKRNGDENMFEILNKKQISSVNKKKACDLTINNNYSLAILEKNVKKIMKIYE